MHYYTIATATIIYKYKGRKMSIHEQGYMNKAKKLNEFLLQQTKHIHFNINYLTHKNIIADLSQADY